MNGYVGLTDFDWYSRLCRDQPWEEVNFWRPSDKKHFRAIAPGAPFFFRLKAPHKAIGGFGYFARQDTAPVWEAWEAFGEANGARDLREFAAKIGGYSLAAKRSGEDHWIGCLIISLPVFFPPDEWVREPAGWSGNIVQGKTIDLTEPDGARVLAECVERASGRTALTLEIIEAETNSRYGSAAVIRPRLGQGAFSMAVRDAYAGACAVTTEHSRPVLEAAHIRPYADGGLHQVENGLLLRRDLHRLFDRGYVTVAPDHRLEVSGRLREEWQNGRAYYELHGREIALPARAGDRPDAAALRWHNDECFRG